MDVTSPPFCGKDMFMNDYKCVTTIQGILDYLGDAKVVAFDYETSPDEKY